MGRAVTTTGPPQFQQVGVARRTPWASCPSTSHGPQVQLTSIRLSTDRSPFGAHRSAPRYRGPRHPIPQRVVYSLEFVVRNQGRPGIDGREPHERPATPDRATRGRRSLRQDCAGHRAPPHRRDGRVGADENRSWCAPTDRTGRWTAWPHSSTPRWPMTAQGTAAKATGDSDGGRGGAVSDGPGQGRRRPAAAVSRGSEPVRTKVSADMSDACSGGRDARGGRPDRPSTEDRRAARH